MWIIMRWIWFTEQLNLEARDCQIKMWNRKYWKKWISRINTQNCRKLISGSLEFHFSNFDCLQTRVFHCLVTDFSKFNYRSSLNEEVRMARETTKYRPCKWYITLNTAAQAYHIAKRVYLRLICVCVYFNMNKGL